MLRSNAALPLPRLILSLAILSITACKKQQGFVMPPPEVTVVTIKPRSAELPVELMGDVQASRSVQVRSQVTGVILERPYVEGSMVTAGEVLFRIDTTQYAANYHSSQAQLADAQARAANAERNIARLRPLLADNAVSRKDVDDAQAELDRSHAAVEAARGQVDRTKKDYDDTIVRAQLAGRAGRAAFVVGSRVTGSADILTTIDALDPVYITFRPSAQQLLAWRRDPAIARALAPGGSARVQLTLADGSVLPRTGKIDFIDPVADSQTGTQAWRATFANADHALVPGQFVRVRLQGLVHANAIFVPQRAVTSAMGRQSVYLVLPNDSTTVRDVITGDVQGSDIEVDSGLAAGDRVIVDGLQKVMPGRKVKPTPLADSGAATPAHPAAPGAAPARPSAAPVRPAPARPSAAPVRPAPAAR
ncbi:MAG TPA: efflux RND transporter periplasmic adaptor subunit [Gemmatimonadales bacterium]